MSHLVADEQMEAFANYAEKHDIFDMFRDCVAKLVIDKPSDPYQFLIDYFARPRRKAIILFAPPGSGLSSVVFGNNLGRFISQAIRICSHKNRTIAESRNLKANCSWDSSRAIC
jgi:hypothetical protein